MNIIEAISLYGDTGIKRASWTYDFIRKYDTGGNVIVNYMIPKGSGVLEIRKNSWTPSADDLTADDWEPWPPVHCLGFVEAIRFHGRAGIRRFGWPPGWKVWVDSNDAVCLSDGLNLRIADVAADDWMRTESRG